jgi:hypothetical protein
MKITEAKKSRATVPVMWQLAAFRNSFLTGLKLGVQLAKLVNPFIEAG